MACSRLSAHIRPSKRVYFTLQRPGIKLVRPLSTVNNTRDYARVSHSRQWSNYNLLRKLMLHVGQAYSTKACKAVVLHYHWRCQLWGTGTRALLDFQLFDFLVHCRAAHIRLHMVAYPVKTVYRSIVALSLFTA